MLTCVVIISCARVCVYNKSSRRRRRVSVHICLRTNEVQSARGREPHRPTDRADGWTDRPTDRRMDGYRAGWTPVTSRESTAGRTATIVPLWPTSQVVGLACSSTVRSSRRRPRRRHFFCSAVDAFTHTHTHTRTRIRVQYT